LGAKGGGPERPYYQKLILASSDPCTECHHFLIVSSLGGGGGEGNKIKIVKRINSLVGKKTKEIVF
jgi:hypothetical protein